MTFLPFSMQGLFEDNELLNRCHIIIIWHGLWAFLQNNHRNQRKSYQNERRHCKEGAGKMGGNKKRFEPASCTEWRKNEEVWSILQQGGLNVFMERLNGKDPTITSYFIKN